MLVEYPNRRQQAQYEQKTKMILWAAYFLTALNIYYIINCVNDAGLDVLGPDLTHRRNRYKLINIV